MASPSNTNTTPDSLHILLQKAHAISTVNQENLDYIQSRKGQQVITKHQYSIRTKPSAAKRQKTQHHVTISTGTSTSTASDATNAMFALLDRKSTKNVDDIISAWRYSGAGALAKENIAINNFIDRTLVGYDDLVRLHSDYDRLLKLYTRLLTDEPECRVAVEGVLRNVEVLQVAIGEIHEQTLEAVDSEKVNTAISSLKKGLSELFESFQSEVSGINFCFRSEIGEEPNESGMVEFLDCTALTCKHTFSEHAGFVTALETYDVNDETFLVSAGYDNKIRVWNLSNNKLVATLTGHTEDVLALKLYVKNGVHILSSGGKDNKIMLWDLSSYTNVQTLDGHEDFIYSLAIHEKGDRVILISGSFDGTTKVWDLDSYTVITSLEGHGYGEIALSVYTHNERPYLASGGNDNKIKIWSIEDYALVQTIDTGEDISINSLVVLDIDESKILASGDNEGRIQLWNLNDYACVKTIEADSDRLNSCLGAMQCDGKVCLTSESDDQTLTIWDLQSDSAIKTLDIGHDMMCSRVFMNGDKACIATGDKGGNIKLWME